MIQSEKFKTFAGIDGCRQGWIAALLTPGRHHPTLRWQVVSQLRDLECLQDAHSLALIDIPIGLPDSLRVMRTCDRAARRFLGPSGRGKVFSPPCREALAPGLSHQEASRKNAQVTDRKLSLQAYYIIPKIREVDQWLRQDLTRNHHCRESHPEAWFYFWNHSQPLTGSKKSSPGKKLRLHLLEELLPGGPESIRRVLRGRSRAHVLPDDAADALALALGAYLSPQLQCLSGKDDVDAAGLPRRILISSEAPLQNASDEPLPKPTKKL